MRQGLRALGHGDRGFTLIEVQVVLAILGVLSVGGLSAAQVVTDRAVTTACGADLADVEIASAAYHADNGGYATAIDDPTHTSTTLVGAGFLKAAPTSTRYTITYNPADGSALGAVGTTACEAADLTRELESV